MPKPTYMPVDRIEYDPRYLPRQRIDLECTVARYTELLVTDPKFDFPEVVVVSTGRGPHLVIDGAHRLIAYQRAERNRIPAAVETLPESRWFARAVELNALHGRPLGIEDRDKIVSRLREDGWELEKVAELLKVRVNTVSMYYADTEKIQPVTAHAKPKQSQRRGGGPLGSGFKPRKPLTRQEKSVSGAVALVMALDTVIRLIRSGNYDLEDEDVADRLRQLRELVA